MKKILMLFLILFVCSCSSTEEPENDVIDYSIPMDTNFIINDCLEDG